MQPSSPEHPPRSPSRQSIIPILTPGLRHAKLRCMKLADFPKLKELPARQKLQLAEELWFDGVDDDSLPVPSWHKELLSERIAAYKIEGQQLFFPNAPK